LLVCKSISEAFFHQLFPPLVDKVTANLL
jgi:hypothetical protein